MRPQLKELLQRAERWPEAAQDEALVTLMAIEERHGGPYVLSDEEWAAVCLGLAQADRNELISDEILAEADKRHGG